MASAALPTGGLVVAGTVAIHQSGNAMTISQGRLRAAIDWQSFSVGAGASVQLVQPRPHELIARRHFFQPASHGNGTCDRGGLALPGEEVCGGQHHAVSAQLQHKRLHDEQRTAGSDERKSSALLSLGLNFDHRDDNGLSYGALTLAFGSLMLNDALRANDANTAKTGGRFTVARLDLSRLHTLPASELGQLTGFVRLAGQWASKNPDSSEGFSLGGPCGVRAYPVGEG